jgi:hypothetical protein
VSVWQPHLDFPIPSSSCVCPRPLHYLVSREKKKESLVVATRSHPHLIRPVWPLVAVFISGLFLIASLEQSNRRTARRTRRRCELSRPSVTSTPACFIIVLVSRSQSTEIENRTPSFGRVRAVRFIGSRPCEALPCPVETDRPRRFGFLQRAAPLRALPLRRDPISL